MIVLAAGILAVCAAEEAPARLNDPYGICAHVSRPDWDWPFAARDFVRMEEARIGWVRTDWDWYRVEPAQGKWNFDLFDRLIALARRDRIHILPILAYDVKWATPAWKHPDAWGEYVRRLVIRYGKKLRCWEVWNEQNSVGFWKDAVKIPWNILSSPPVPVSTEVPPIFRFPRMIRWRIRSVCMPRRKKAAN